MTKGSETKY